MVRDFMIKLQSQLSIDLISSFHCNTLRNKIWYALYLPALPSSSALQSNMWVTSSMQSSAPQPHLEHLCRIWSPWKLVPIPYRSTYINKQFMYADIQGCTVSRYGAPGECGPEQSLNIKFMICSNSVQTLFKQYSNNVQIQTLFIYCSNSFI